MTAEMSSRENPHFFFDATGSTEPFTPRMGRRGSGTQYPDVDPVRHGEFLRDRLADSVRAASEIASLAPQLTGQPKSGYHLTFESFEDTPFDLKKFENRRLKIPSELVAVRSVEAAEGRKELATVWMPKKAVDSLDRKLEKFSTGFTKKGRPLNEPLAAPIANVAAARLEELWTEPLKPFPSRVEVRWWEVWLARRTGDEPQALASAMGRIDAEIAPGRLDFPDRTVMKVRASAEELAQVILLLDGVAELRDVSASPEFFHALPAGEQVQWIEDLLERTVFPNGGRTPAACVLDTGLRWKHPLLRPAVLRDGLHAYNPNWGLADDVGHGTEMAGIALFHGSLAEALASMDRVVVPIGLESVKILPPPPGRNPKELWGTITASAVALVEASAPERRRAFTMAITAPDHPQNGRADGGDRAEVYGFPTSWSASVDAIASGQAIDITSEGITAIEDRDPTAARLIVVSAGNVRPPWEREYKDLCALSPVEDPAQAWNALTVGAFTSLGDPSPHADHRPLAEAGDLSPRSRTSQLFAPEWPIKPDVVFEGGNLALGPQGEIIDPEGMMILTTDGRTESWHPQNLVVTSGTSPATAMAGGFAARIWAEYPSLWPETVRALVSHSARWTPPMRRAIESTSSFAERGPLVRAFGMGVPLLERALKSASDEVTLVVEETIRPFDEGKHREMHLHSLPWPAAELRGLGELPVRLRVTLSFFVAPNPSRRGWRGRYVYPSHGLRFDVQRPLESVSAFRARINERADVGDHATVAESGRWTLGPQLRRRGSLITDIWSGTAAELANRGSIAVFPSMGWWKAQGVDSESDRGARYALIVSIEAPEANVDLWQAISNQIALPTSVDIES